MVGAWVTWNGAAFWMLGITVGAVVMLILKRREQRKIREWDDQIERNR